MPYPAQSNRLGDYVAVHVAGDDSKPVYGEIMRDDAAEFGGTTIIALEDGRFVTGEECVILAHTHNHVFEARAARAMRKRRPPTVWLPPDSSESESE